MAKTLKSRPTKKQSQMPFNAELGPRLGSGQDNAVFTLVEPGRDRKHPEKTGQVLKINHNNMHRTRDPDVRQAAWKGIQYKKNKYELLKMFLGDFVPESSFVLGKVDEGNGPRYAEYTIQEEVPRISLNQLTPDQRMDPRLVKQVTDLMGRLSYMYKVLGEVNARTAHSVSLDGKLDLGGVSDNVRVESLDHLFDENDAQRVIQENKSPNLLVNPDSMQLYCIDFDQGQWEDGANEAKAMAIQIYNRDQLLEPTIRTASAHVAVEQYAQLSLVA